METRTDSDMSRPKKEIESGREMNEGEEVCLTMCKHVDIHYLCVYIFMERREQTDKKNERKRKRVRAIV